MNVERLSKSLRKVSYGLGGVAVMFFTLAFFSLMAHTATQSAREVSKPKLQSGLFDDLSDIAAAKKFYD